MLLTLKNISVGYERQAVLKNISLTVNRGDFIGIIGPNGGGKTTLLKLILGLLKPWQGKIIMDSHMTLAKEKAIGYLPQYNNFDRQFPITVKDIVLSGFITPKKIFRRYTPQERARVDTLLQEMGIYTLRDKAPSELSGGELQRTLLCRSLASNPEMLILDEPNTYVDNQFEHELYEKLRSLNQAGKTILLVTHDIGTVAHYIKTIACVNETLHLHPSNKITAQQLAAYNCPLQIITHGDIPHTVLKRHDHFHE
ncbi:MAG: zinc ABC transporter ATP-binding protein [Bacteroidetes bacterium]|nr:MAG: zinc ABC transporter ATP-binding protein [Bacteroidota bacterium]